MEKSKWIWMPHARHFIAGDECRFHLCTYVGKYIVSTVGEYLLSSGVREILAPIRGITLEGIGDARQADWMRKVGYEDLGLGRKYETMVFLAVRVTPKEWLCCPWKQKSGSNIDMDGYNDAVAAFKGHMKLCLKWSKR